LFSSARRRVAVSTSKMPPQQPDRLLDVFNQIVSFRAHKALIHNKATSHASNFRDVASPAQ
jgi:hypothetical protein